MRSFRLHILLWLLLGYSFAAAQPVLRLKTGDTHPESNVRKFSYTEVVKTEPAFEGKIFRIISFTKSISQAEKQDLANAGIELLQYVPDNAYTAAISREQDEEFLTRHNIHAIIALDPSQKLSRQLRENRVPAWAVKQENSIDLVVHFSKAIKASTAIGYLLSKQYRVIDMSWKEYGFVTLRVNRDKLTELAGTPFVEYIEPLAPDPKPFNFLAKANTRANILNAPAASGGEDLRGRGVTIGIGDDGDPSGHVDLQDRVSNHAAAPRQLHATHVTGIAAGAGLKDPMFEGIAPEATVVAQLFNGIFLNAAAYIADYRMVVTNNSWGNITGECELTGVYDTYSRLMDEISLRFPYLLHVFAAGNDGPFTCLGFPKQYHTIVSGHQSAKNVLSVGWAEKNRSVSLNSSVGPTADGRLKPEIVSQGSGIRSTAPGNDYFTDWGTSMAAPTVAGGAALLIEKYREMHAGADPKSGLIKALLMNGAADIENPAPDFKSGYGFLHLVRSLAMLKQNRFFNSDVANGSTNTHTINVTPGTASLKVMIYWHDPAAAIFAANSLVNDVDIEISTPSGTVILPWRLASDSLGAANAATRQADHANNSEQITIDNPVAGNYTIRVKGTAINAGPTQEYFLVYDLVPAGVELSFPSAGEPLVPGEAIVVQWDAWGDPANNFTLEYSIDDGASWTMIDNNITANARQYNWTVPGVATATAKMRLSRNGTAYADTSHSFVVLGQPSISLATVQCEDRANLNWNNIPGATDYEVMMKNGARMVTMATTTGTNYIQHGLDDDSSYWFSVRARINGQPGRRAIALNYKPDQGGCAGTISDNDLKMDSVLAPVNGRKFTSTEITSNSLRVQVKNLDDAPVTGFKLGYSINGSSYVEEMVAATITPGGTYQHSFNGIDFSAAGNYQVVVAVTNNTADPYRFNDTLRTTIRQLPNPPIALPYFEGFESASIFDTRKQTTGLPGLEHWDFINSTHAGRARSFVSSGFAKTGNRALTIDASEFSLSGNTNFLTATFNLGNYATVPAGDLGLKLEFSYLFQGRKSHPDNRVWARAKDTHAWQEVFNFDSLVLNKGEWKTVAIHLSHLFDTVAPGTSFQLRFGQHGNFPAGDSMTGHGLSIDDLRLVSTPYDVELAEIVSPGAFNCGNITDQPLVIRYRDYRGVSGCIPVSYRLNGGDIVTECMVTGPAGSYTFSKRLNIPSNGIHLLEAWVAHPADTYRANDTVRLLVRSKPVVNRFPYLENFEAGPGHWHTEGFLSSWEWGKPASFRINKAASGIHAWKTKLGGQYNENEHSYLYSPCFDISTLASPVLSFNMAIDLEQCRPFSCDQLWMEYTNDGKNWTKLGGFGQGSNWYNNQQDNAWDTAGRVNWHIASIDLPKTTGSLQLRFVLRSDAGITREGVAIDDVQVFDRHADADEGWRVLPNPTTGLLQLLSTHEPGARVELQLFDATGRLIQRRSLNATGLLDRTVLDLSHLSRGVYLLRVTDGRQEKTFRVVKQ